MGKMLPRGAIVHHFNEDPSDNRNGNLVVCPDDAYHFLLHARARVLRAGGEPNREKFCSRCDKTKPFSEFTRSTKAHDGLHNFCRDCNKAASRAYRQRRANA